LALSWAEVWETRSGWGSGCQKARATAPVLVGVKAKVLLSVLRWALGWAPTRERVKAPELEQRWEHKLASVKVLELEVVSGWESVMEKDAATGAALAGRKAPQMEAESAQWWARVLAVGSALGSGAGSELGLERETG